MASRRPASTYPHAGARPRGRTPSPNGSCRRSSRRPEVRSGGRRGGAAVRRGVQTRGLYGICMLSNFWQWSGGFAQFIAWADGGPIPFSPPMPTAAGSLPDVRTAASTRTPRRWSSTRLHRVPRPALKKDPMVIWELANEPCGLTRSGFSRLDPPDGAADQVPGAFAALHHRQRGADRHAWYAGVDPVKDHAEPGDRLHLLSHVGRELGLGPRRSLPTGYPKALDLAKKYVNRHAELAASSASRSCWKSSAFRATAAASIRPRRRPSATGTFRRSTRWFR